MSCTQIHPYLKQKVYIETMYPWPHWSQAQPSHAWRCSVLHFELGPECHVSHDPARDGISDWTFQFKSEIMDSNVRMPALVFRRGIKNKLQSQTISLWFHSCFQHLLWVKLSASLTEPRHWCVSKSMLVSRPLPMRFRISVAFKYNTKHSTWVRHGMVSEVNIKTCPWLRPCSS